MLLSKIYDIGRLYPTTQRVVGFTLPFYKSSNNIANKSLAIYVASAISSPQVATLKSIPKILHIIQKMSNLLGFTGIY